VIDRATRAGRRRGDLRNAVLTLAEGARYIDAPAPGPLTVEASHRDGELMFAVRDEGRGMLPRPHGPGVNLGLSLIGRLAQRLEINENGACGTEVRLMFMSAEH